jgi:hypothetical protein
VLNTLNADKKKTPLKNHVVSLSTFRRRRQIKNIIRIFKVSIGKLLDRACGFFSTCDLKPYLAGAAIVLIFYLLYAILRLEMEVKRMHRLIEKVGYQVISQENSRLKGASGQSEMNCRQDIEMTNPE